MANANSWNSAGNRLYYASFYMVSAYMVHIGIIVTTHSGAKAAFNKELILTGMLSRERGLLYNRLFNLRQESDYEDFFSATEQDVLPMIPEVEVLLIEISNLIHESKV